MHRQQRLSTVSSLKTQAHQRETNNSQRMKELRALKESGIDNLNIKIKGLLDRLSREGLHKPKPGIKERTKTEYSDFTDNTESGCSFGSDLSNFESFGDSIGRSEQKQVTLPMSIQITGVSFRRRKNKEEQLQKIKLKYHKRNASRQDSVDSCQSRHPILCKDSQEPFRFKKYPQQTFQQSKSPMRESPMLNKMVIRSSKGNTASRDALVDTTNIYTSFDQLKKQSKRGYGRELKRGSMEESEPVTASFRAMQIHRDDSFFVSDFRRLAQHLKRQVELDESFRHCKKWFQRESSTYKWVELSTELKRNRISLDESAIRQLFVLRQEEEDPFTSLRGLESSFGELVECFVNCEEYWFANIAKKYSQRSLESQGLGEERLDLTGKGRVDVEDLVRFGNLEMDLDVRVRDMFLIFERLRNKDILTYQDLTQGLCF